MMDRQTSAHTGASFRMPFSTASHTAGFSLSVGAMTMASIIVICALLVGVLVLRGFLAGLVGIIVRAVLLAERQSDSAVRQNA